MVGRTAPFRALLVNDCALAGHHGSALVTSQLERLGAEAGLEVMTGWTWEAALDALARDDAGAFDLVLVNGEGSLHSNSRAAERIAQIAVTQRDRRPAYLVNATVEGNSDRLDGDLGAFRLRFVRDSRSQSTLQRVGVAAQVVPDLTLSAAHLPRASGEGPILVTDASHEGTSRRLIALAKHAGGRAVTLRAPPPWPKQGISRRRIGFEVKRQAARLAPPSPWSLRYAGALEQRAFQDLLARGAGSIVCGRYHAVCLALRMGVPFLAIEGNTGKTSALLADVGIEPRCVAITELEQTGRPLTVAPFTQLEQHRIQRFLNGAEVRASAMLRQIADDTAAWYGVAVDVAAEAVA